MNKQQLSEARRRYERDLSKGFGGSDPPLIIAAARLVERLLPGECECLSKHPDERVSHRLLRTACHGSGQVWDEGIVEAVAKALPDSEHFSTDEDYHQAARIVLSAIAQLAEAGSQ